MLLDPEHKCEPDRLVKVDDDSRDVSSDEVRPLREEIFPLGASTPRRPCSCRTVVACLVSVLISLALFAMTLSHMNRQEKLPTWKLSCGDTVPEAMARGCHYEPMLRSWIPDLCYFPEPSSEYRPFDDRAWFEDEDLTIPADVERLRSGDDYTAHTNIFHMEHCLYAWRKLAIATDRRFDWLDTKSYSVSHANHCAKQIAGELQAVANRTWVPDDLFTSTPIMFQTCVRLPWAK